MFISSASDYREAAKHKLPRFLFDYIDGGAHDEQTMKANIADLQQIALQQRVLKNVSPVNLTTELFGQLLAMPLVLAPVGLTGMYARRGEVQAAKAAEKKGIPFTLSTVSVCPIEEVVSQTSQTIWFQLYVLKDRGFMQHVLERARAAGIKNLVFTVDMPTPGRRYRDARSGLSGPFATQRRLWQTMLKPAWALQVGLLGRPHDLGNISAYLGKPMGLKNYMGWLNQHFDPSISWADLEWIRDFWQGPLIIKGILDPDDAKEAVRFGADGIIVSNHGGRQLDGVLSTAKMLPKIADAVGNDLTLLVDSGIRSGLDVVRMLALGAKAVLLGRMAVFALAARGQAGLEHLLDIFADEIRNTMILTGVKSMGEISRSNLT